MIVTIVALDLLLSLHPTLPYETDWSRRLRIDDIMIMRFCFSLIEAAHIVVNCCYIRSIAVRRPL